MTSQDLDYWNDFYNNTSNAIDRPSEFAIFVEKILSGKCNQILDIGCGNLRDTQFFKLLGYDVIGIDQADVSNIADDHNIKFFQVDVNQINFSNIEKKFIAQDGCYIAYARFFLHAIKDEVSDKLIKKIIKNIKIKAICLEFRTEDDVHLPKTFSNHKRYFKNLKHVSDIIKSENRFKEIVSIESRGLSIFQNEDPMIARLIFAEE